MREVNDPLVLEIAFSKAKGIRAATAPELLDRVGGLKQFFTLSRAELHHLTGLNTEIFGEVYRQQLLDFAEKEAAHVRSHHIDPIFLLSDKYPKRLLNCEDAPMMLYQCGSCNLDRAHAIAIVGTRNATAYGIDFAARLVDELAKKVDDLLIVSGLAYGIDVTAHRASLSNNVATVGVIAHGFDGHIYPAVHRDVAAHMVRSGGALVTEYTTDQTEQKSNFLKRNRIIAGLTDCTVVVESEVRGGSMSTARTAMNYNRDVFAVPGRVNDLKSSGTNMLIANHTASLLQCADDIIEQMGWPTKEEATQEAAPQLFRALKPEEEEIMLFIRSNPDATINDICVRMSKSYAIISDLLFQLEMDDLITTLPGGRYSITTMK